MPRQLYHPQGARDGQGMAPQSAGQGLRQSTDCIEGCCLAHLCTIMHCLCTFRSKDVAEAEAEAEVLDALRSGSKRDSIPRASPEEAAQDLGILPDAQV